MAKVIPIEHFQHFVEELQEGFWGDLYGRTRQAWKKFFELETERQCDHYAGLAAQHGRGPAAGGKISQRVLPARVCHGVRHHSSAHRTDAGEEFLPSGLERFQRRAPELVMLIREAFLRGLSTRQSLVHLAANYSPSDPVFANEALSRLGDQSNEEMWHKGAGLCAPER